MVLYCVRPKAPTRRKLQGPCMYDARYMHIIRLSKVYISDTLFSQRSTLGGSRPSKARRAGERQRRSGSHDCCQPRRVIVSPGLIGLRAPCPHVVYHVASSPEHTSTPAPIRHTDFQSCTIIDSLRSAYPSPHLYNMLIPMASSHSTPNPFHSFGNADLND